MAALLEPPDYEERVCIVGSNGSGKSFFAKALLERYRRWVVVDHKGGFLPNGDRGSYVIVRDPHDERLKTEDRVVYRPRNEWKTAEMYEFVFESLIYRAERYGRRGRPFVVVVDEGLAISRLGARKQLGNLAAVGREHGVGLWVLSQRAKWIPIEVKSEAWRWYVFYLGDSEDEDEVLRFAKGQLTLEQLRAHDHSKQFTELRRAENSGGVVKVTLWPALPPSRAVRSK
ncbi:MAG: type IV secretory system conjugative DNA transfer family protein [Candidatus Dormibacteraceae bacterium]